MSDLSWFNPTPHAIAVYASRPLATVGAKRSLPSGRYSLLGPDFHRLDRTSLRLAHSFDHLVGDGEHARRNGQTERVDRSADACLMSSIPQWRLIGVLLSSTPRVCSRTAMAVGRSTGRGRRRRPNGSLV